MIIDENAPRYINVLCGTCRVDGVSPGTYQRQSDASKVAPKGEKKSPKMKGAPKGEKRYKNEECKMSPDEVDKSFRFP